MKQKIVYFDLDGVMADYENQPSYKDNPEIPQKGFFENLQPINGAIDAFKKLSEYYDCYFLTTAPWSNTHSLSEKRIWVEKHLGEYAFKKLITTHRKDLAKGDYLIDDRTVNGAGEFDGVHIHFGSEDFPNWDSVVNYLTNPIDKDKVLEEQIISLLLMNHSHHHDDDEGLIDTAKEIMREIKSHYGK